MASSESGHHTDIIVGIIGAGANTRLRHIPELQAQMGVRIKTVCNRTIESAEAVCSAHQIPEAVADYRSVLQDPEINAICIGTWPYMHAQLSIEALHAGKHVLCEARMAMDAGEAQAMLTASRSHPSLVAQLVPSPFTYAWDATIQNIISSGQLGSLHSISVRGVGASPFPTPLEAMTWRQDCRRSGLNILTMGIAYEALHRWVGGATSVFASGRTMVKLRTDTETHAPLAVEVPDHVDIIADMACGAQAHMVFSATCGESGGSTRPQHEFWLYGSEGTLHLDVDNGVLEMAIKGSGGKMQHVDVPDGQRGHWRVEQEFVSAIRGEEKVKLTDFETGVAYMEFTEAVWRSMQRREMVGLPLLA